MRYDKHTSHLLSNPSAWMLAKVASDLGLTEEPSVEVESKGEQMELIEENQK